MIHHSIFDLQLANSSQILNSIISQADMCATTEHWPRAPFGFKRISHPYGTFCNKNKQKIILTSVTYPSFFYDICDHDHNCTVLFPDHPPKIFDCVGHGSFKRPKINGT